MNISRLFLVFTCLLLGCSSNLRPVEMPNKDGPPLRGFYVTCVSDLDCDAKMSGVCPDGYWIASYVNEGAALSRIGEIVICR